MIHFGFPVTSSHNETDLVSDGLKPALAGTALPVPKASHRLQPVVVDYGLIAKSLKAVNV